MNMTQDHLMPMACNGLATVTPTKPRERVLVVDDTEDKLFMMNALLDDRYEALLASSGWLVMAIIMSQAPPDLILLDMDGYEVLRRIRQHPPTTLIPVIFLTALSTMEEEHPGLEKAWLSCKSSGKAGARPKVFVSASAATPAFVMWATSAAIRACGTPSFPSWPLE